MAYADVLSNQYLCSVYRLSLHLLFWICFLLWSSAIVEWHNISANCDKSFFSNIKHIAGRLPIIMAATYLLVYKILPDNLFNNKSVGKFAFNFGVLFIVTTLIDRSFIGIIDSNAFRISGAFQCTFLNLQPIIRNALILATVMGMAFVIRFYRIHLANEEYQHALIQDNLSNQLSFLKAQVSPHFLFNALNNIYSDCVQKDETEIASNIEHLSGIMRYLTYDSSAKYVSLLKEIQLVEDYIAVERMRISDADNVTITFLTDGDFSKHKIAPVLLLPLVENTFKHGIANDQNCFIFISIKMRGDEIFFETRNTNATLSSDNDGVGLKNVNERLSLMYKCNYTLQKQIGKTDFALTLKIRLDAN